MPKTPVAGLSMELLRQALANTMHQFNPAGDAPSLVWADGSPLTPEDAGRAFVATIAAEYARLAATPPAPDADPA